MRVILFAGGLFMWVATGYFCAATIMLQQGFWIVPAIAASLSCGGMLVWMGRRG